MPELMIAPGHGRRDNGTVDYGVSWAGLTEHLLAHQVVEAAANAYTRSGVDALVERDEGVRHDPNFAGTIRTANAHPSLRCLDAVHFNAAGGSGVEVLVHPSTSEANRETCRRIAASVAEVLGLKVRRDRGLWVTDRFALLRGTRAPAAIIEVAFVDHPVDRLALTRRGVLIEVGEAIAAERCRFLGNPYVPPKAPRRRLAVALTAAREPDRAYARLLAARWTFAYVIRTPDGWVRVDPDTGTILEPVDIAHLVAFGWHADDEVAANGGHGQAVSGANRYEVEAKVRSMFDQAPDRVTAWS